MGLTRLRWWHLDAVLAIEADLFGPERWTAAMFWGELAAGHHYLAALDADGALRGYAGLALSPGEAWVQNIAVGRAGQRRGTGRALLEALLAHAAAAGAPVVMLEVAADNGPAQRLYDRYGFAAVGVRRGYYQPSNTDAIVMRRQS
ncbi:ribosomal protein S18-alanine N-acetyltransferase [Pilimelia terevasa]|uniref:ribosomal protein S18-alanine N-acetyltransferase n=1 Tax=Pilimelia terevasa TaxID=53372 RepID=UPI00166CF137|nr:ribosomal protein S18-alanine N-acetyltransferase [Pilimelia terevasa]